MSIKKDPIFSDRQVEMDSLEIVPLIQAVALVRRITQTLPIHEAPVDEDGVPYEDRYNDPATDLKIPGAYLSLNSYATIVKELHAQGYRIVKGAEHKPYFHPL